jgi:hypothetical protein
VSKTSTFVCLSECLSPITHMAGVEGNEAIVAREAATPRGVAMVPYLSGNAIRNRCVREPGMRWLIDEWGLAGELSLLQLNFLLHGGSLTEGGAKEDTARVVAMGRLMPLARLLGGCLPDQVLAGSLHCWRGTLVAEENRPALMAMGLPIPDRLRPAESFVSGYQYTRSDAGKGTPALAAGGDRPADAPSNLMIFSGQAVMRGAIFAHGFTVRHGSDLECGALLWSLRLWQGSGGTVGGMAARGHGRLATSLVGGPDAAEAGRLCDLYRAHAEANGDEGRAWLAAAFAPKGKASADGKAPRKGARAS